MKRCCFCLASALIFTACKPEAEPASPEVVARQQLLKDLRSAAAGAEFRRQLAEIPEATELAKQDQKDAETRLAKLERRAIQSGLISEQIDPEIAAGQKIGADNAKQTLEDRAARKNEVEKP